MKYLYYTEWRGNRLLKKGFYQCITYLIIFFIFIFITIIPAPTANSSENVSTLFIDLPGFDTFVHEEHMVWFISNKKNEKVIMYKNILTGEEKQITKDYTIKYDLSISVTSADEPIIVWTDKRNYSALEANSDIYSYNLKTGKEKKLNSEKELDFKKPIIDGDYVVWNKSSLGHSIYMYDLIKNIETRIGYGRDPILANNKVLFLRSDSTGLNLYDTKTNTTSFLLKLPYYKYNYEYIHGFAFNGKNVLYRLRNSDGNSKIYMGTILGDTFTTKELTSYEQRYNRYEIGDNYAAWLAEINGRSKVMVVDLRTGKESQATNNNSDPHSFFFWGDRLVMKGFREKDTFITAVQNHPKPEKPIQVYIEGELTPFSVHPIIENGNTLVQFRPIFEQLGLEVEWDPTTKTIKGKNDSTTVQLKINDKKVTVNGKIMDLPVAPKIVNGNTMVPLRFISEATNRNVNWNSNTKMITINEKVEMGKVFYSSGQLMYEGELKDQKFFHGKGKLYRIDGTLWYDAEFKDHEVVYGTIYYPDNHRVVGEFENGAPNGTGTYYLDNGEMWYEGEFKDGRKHGKGKFYHWESGVLIYNGEWQNNLRHGYGIEYENYEHRETIKYEGYFENDNYNGHGEKREFAPGSNEAYLVAEYVQGKANGQGKLIIGKGVIVEGTVKNGKFEGKAKRYYGEGIYADVIFKTGTIETGTVYDSDGKVIYNGEFVGYFPKDERIQFYLKMGSWPENN